MDILTIIGILIGFGAIIGGLVIEGGSVYAILQGTAAIIVFGGTLGAVLVQYPASTVLLAVKNVRKVFLDRRIDDVLALQQARGRLDRLRPPLFDLFRRLQDAGRGYKVRRRRPV